MKTDLQLETAIVTALERHPAIDSERIAVAVHQGAARLTGNVETLAEYRAIERALGRFDGVDGVVLTVDIRVAPVRRRTDAEVAGAIEHGLRWHSVVPRDQVRVTVEGGCVVLCGEVGCDWQRASAEESVQRVTGVRRIRNEIRIRSGARGASGWEQLASDLARQARRVPAGERPRGVGPAATASGDTESHGR